MYLNGFGEIVRCEWLRTAELRQGIGLDVFEVMPNHMHGIVVLEKAVSKFFTGDRPVAATRPRLGSLGAVVGNFKAAVTGRIRLQFHKPDLQVWQRNYYDHIITDDDDWECIRGYILDNPANWSSDSENPLNSGR